MAVFRQDIKCKNGNEFWLCKFTGKVASQRQWSETNVNQGAATVMPSQYGNHTVIPGRITTSTSNKQDIWLLNEDGEEQNFKFTNANFPLREGHEISVVWCGGKDSKTGVNLWALNKATNSVFDVRSSVIPTSNSNKTNSFYIVCWIIAACIPPINFVVIPVLIYKVIVYLKNQSKLNKDASEIIAFAKEYVMVHG